MCPPESGPERGWTSVSADSKELLEEIENKQADIVRLQVEKEAAELRKEELGALLVESAVPQKHRKRKRTRVTEQEQLNHKLQASLRTVQPAGQAAWSAKQCGEGSCGS